MPGVISESYDHPDPRMQQYLRLRLFAEIAKERRLQDEQWGGPMHDDQHPWADWLGFIQKQVKSATSPDFRERMVKVAALAIAAIESHDRGLSPEEGK